MMETSRLASLKQPEVVAEVLTMMETSRLASLKQPEVVAEVLTVQETPKLASCVLKGNGPAVLAYAANKCICNRASSTN
jgi:hypothetical protein